MDILSWEDRPVISSKSLATGLSVVWKIQALRRNANTVPPKPTDRSLLPYAVLRKPFLLKPHLILVGFTTQHALPSQLPEQGFGFFPRAWLLLASPLGSRHQKSHQPALVSVLCLALLGTRTFQLSLSHGLNTSSGSFISNTVVSVHRVLEVLVKPPI